MERGQKGKAVKITPETVQSTLRGLQEFCSTTVGRDAIRAGLFSATDPETAAAYAIDLSTLAKHLMPILQSAQAKVEEMTAEADQDDKRKAS